MPTLDELYNSARFKQPLPIPPTIHPHHRARIEMKAAQAKLHPDLPASDLWTYEGVSPGPTIEVRTGQSVDIDWANSIHSLLPVTVVHSPTDIARPPQNSAGVETGADTDMQFQTLPAWTVVHLHGGRTDADFDGWPENVTAIGRSVRYTYQFDRSDRARMLWYHDHAMSVTRLNVYAGLAGLWMLRDEEDDAVMTALRRTRPDSFSASDPIEIPLLIQDRNLETSADGNLTGKLLHKVEDRPLDNPGPMEFFGPMTLVNGAIWPHVELHRLPYRLRVINGSNARVFRLVLQDESGNSYNQCLSQIGTDGGLLGAPVDIPADGLLLAGAERADLILDLSKLSHSVQSLRWVNTAPAPFGNDPAPTDVEKRVAARLKYPDVMEFRISSNAVAHQVLELPNPLSSFRRLTHDDLGENHTHRLIALVERDRLELRELFKVDPPPPLPLDPNMFLLLKSEPDPADPVVYEMRPAGFSDTVNIQVPFGAKEAWKFLNLTSDTHPVHVHLTQFQLSNENGRVAYQVPLRVTEFGGVVSIDTTQTQAPDDKEIGWKDTIRVNPGEMVTILAPFDSRAGRYLYHCHILEHEDHEMMRPFVVLPQGLMMDMPMPAMNMPAKHS